MLTPAQQKALDFIKDYLTRRVALGWQKEEQITGIPASIPCPCWEPIRAGYLIK